MGNGRSELVRLAARLIIEEALEGEARDALGRDSKAGAAGGSAGGAVSATAGAAVEPAGSAVPNLAARP